MKFLFGWELEYQNDDYNLDNDEHNELNLPNTCKWCSDGSVDGGEIKLINPSTFVEASKALVALENNINFTELGIDIGCSFHVHISETYMHQFYDLDMQVAMIQYIYDNLDKVPKSVLKRWSSLNQSVRDQYFGLRCDLGKYNFIAYRPEHGTWEFRCFGNVNNAEDGKICMRLAKDAYKWACKYKTTDKVLSHIPLTAAVDKLLGMEPQCSRIA